MLNGTKLKRSQKYELNSGDEVCLSAKTPALIRAANGKN
jgi:hypothetical protein